MLDETSATEEELNKISLTKYSLWCMVSTLSFNIIYENAAECLALWAGMNAAISKT